MCDMFIKIITYHTFYIQLKIYPLKPGHDFNAIFIIMFLNIALSVFISDIPFMREYHIH